MANRFRSYIQEISLFSTDLRTTDNKHVIVPNGTIWSNVITNYTTEDIRRIDMVFGLLPPGHAASV